MAIEVESYDQMHGNENGSDMSFMRDYSAGDREAITAAFDELLQTPEGRAALQSRFLHVPPHDAFVRYLDDPAVLHRSVAWSSSGELLGWGEYYPDGLTSRDAVLGIFVLPQYQRRGIGTDLSEHLIEECRDRNPGIKKIKALVHSGNAPAMQSLTRVVKNIGGYRNPIEKTPLVRFSFPIK